MRVTGGIARGIQLRVPTQGGVRPATDYIREAVFNSLAAFVPGTAVLDLFAGTGAYGLESLSRGALRATCVDQRIGAELTANAAAVAKSMGVAELPFTKITGDATKPGVAAGRFDLVFADAADAQPDAIEVVAYRLRKRLPAASAKLVTLRGLGYLLQSDD